MGIHHTYKSQRGERSLQKQQKQEERKRKAKQRQRQRSQNNVQGDVYVVPENEVLTLDALTNPNKK